MSDDKPKWPDPPSNEWRGQALLDLDIIAETDDDAMNAIVDYLAPVLGKGCSISERRIVLRQFFGHPKAPWQGGEMTTNASQLLERAKELADTVEGGAFPGASKPDFHAHREILEDAIDHALRRNYRDGVKTGKLSYRKDLDRVIEDSKTPSHVAKLLRDFAAKYDERGWTDEANLLRDAATQVGDITQDLGIPQRLEDEPETEEDLL